MTDYEIFIPCRVTSERLPFKHFRTIDGLTLIEHLIVRLGEITDAHVNIIAPDCKENDIYEELTSLYRVSVFRGAEHDVLDRFVKAANARSEHTQYAVRINGDSILPNAELFGKLDAMMSKKAHDIYTTVGSNITSGQHIEAVRISWLIDQAAHIAEASDYQREHVFPLLYDLSEATHRLDASVAAKVKLSVDNYKDLERQRYFHEMKLCSDLTKLDEAADAFTQERPFIGENGAYLIAEIGGNHEGDFDYAKKLVASACATEVDAIKLQIYSPDLLVNKRLDPDRHAHFSKFALAREQYSELFAMIRDAGKHTSASVWSLEETAEHENDIDLLKIGSGDLTAAPILRYLAGLDKPLVLSTGLATMEQAKTAYQTVLDTGLAREKLAILQCTSMYPIPDVEANLAVMREFANAFDCVIGYSDHTVGYDVLLDSITAGAKVLEFHFSDDTSNSAFRDHLVSLDEDDTNRFVDAMRTKMMRLGSSHKHLSMMERARNHPQSFRKGLFLRHDVSEGHVVTESDLIALRPLDGIDAVDFYSVTGRKAVKDIAALEALSWDMFSGNSD